MVVVVVGGRVVDVVDVVDVAVGSVVEVVDVTGGSVDVVEVVDVVVVEVVDVVEVDVVTGRVVDVVGGSVVEVVEVVAGRVVDVVVVVWDMPLARKIESTESVPWLTPDQSWNVMSTEAPAGTGLVNGISYVLHAFAGIGPPRSDTVASPPATPFTVMYTRTTWPPTGPPFIEKRSFDVARGSESWCKAMPAQLSGSHDTAREPSAGDGDASECVAHDQSAQPGDSASP